MSRDPNAFGDTTRTDTTDTQIVTDLTSAIRTDFNWRTTEITFSFEVAGTPVDEGDSPYEGGSSVTSTWTEAEKQMVRDAMEHVATFTGLTFTETANTGQSMIDFEKVEEVPGGWAGYAYYPNGSGKVVIGSQWIDPAVSNTTIHEIGHALGLSHTHNRGTFPGVVSSNDPGDNDLNSSLISTMSYRGARDPLRPDMFINADEPNFMAVDIAALQLIYGANTTYASGRDSYGIITELKTIWDTGGRDTIDFRAATEDAVIDLRAATLLPEEGGGGYLSFVYSYRTDVSSGTDGGYTIANGVVIERAFGGSGNDEITGNNAANTIKAAQGNDSALGLGGKDTIQGGTGQDTLNGGSGNDRISGQGDADTLIGGAGKDRLDGGSGLDDLSGGKGNDRLSGGGDADTLSGGKGRDQIQGGTGNDTLEGGKGADTFIYKAGWGVDRIIDFSTSADTLKISGLGNLNAVLATATEAGGDVTFEFGGGNRLIVENVSLADLTSQLDV